MKCLSWKVIGALAALGLGIYFVAPGLAAGAVPLLVLAVCPLSMLLMMRAMGSMGRHSTSDEAGAAHADEVARLRAEVAALRAEGEGRQEARWTR